jgi:TRAP-type C4-dicarboxylate transport system permease small subunit
MIKRIYAHLDEHVETYLSSVTLLLFTVLTIVQVFMRYVLDSPLTWSEEIARYALVWFVYTSASYAVRYQRHVKFNVLTKMLGRRIPIAERAVQIFVFLLWLAFLLLILVLSIQMVLAQYRTGQVSAAAQLPMYLVYIGLPLGMALMSFRVLQHLVRAAVDIVKNRNAPIPPAELEVM